MFPVSDKVNKPRSRWTLTAVPLVGAVAAVRFAVAAPAPVDALVRGETAVELGRGADLGS